MKLNENETYLKISQDQKYITSIKGWCYSGYRGKKEDFKKEESFLISSSRKIFKIKSQEITKEIKSKNIIKNFFNIVDYYEVKTNVEEFEFNFKNIKDMVLNVIHYEYYNEDWKYNVYDEIEEKEFNILFKKIKNAKDIEEIFELLQVNNEDNIIDTF